MEARWRESSEEVLTGMKEWRLQHPKATFREIETALDERLGKARARLLEDAALLSTAATEVSTAATEVSTAATEVSTAATEVSTAATEERPRGPRWGEALEARGQATRELTTTFNQTIRLNRSYAEAEPCGLPILWRGAFPPWMRNWDCCRAG